MINVDFVAQEDTSIMQGGEWIIIVEHLTVSSFSGKASLAFPMLILMIPPKQLISRLKLLRPGGFLSKTAPFREK